jgi:fibronectin-binding autotransporter adhesin
MRAQKGQFSWFRGSVWATVILAMAIAGPSLAGAADVSWTAGDGLWSSVGSWNTGAVPQSGQYASIENGAAVSYDLSGGATDPAPAQIALINGSSLTIPETTFTGTLYLGPSNGDAPLLLDTGATVTQNGGTVFLNNSPGVQGLLLGQNGGATYNLNVLDPGNSTLLHNYADAYIGNGGTGMSTFNHYAGTHTVEGSLVLGYWGSGYGVYNLYDGTLNVGTATTGSLTVGNYGTGELNMTGGTLNINNNDNNTAAFVIGNNAGSVGTFTQSGGVVNGGRSLTIGYNGGTGTYNLNTDPNGTTPTLNTGFITFFDGTGVFNQQDGTINNTGSLYMGAGSTYNLFGGTLNVTGDQGTIVGTSGWATFNQSGGTHTTDALIVGNAVGFGGIYNLTGGMLTSGNATAGNEGTGTFIVSDFDGPSTHTVNGNLILGNQATGIGSYTITGDYSRLDITFAPGGNIGDTTGFPNGYPNGALIIGELGNGSFTQGTGLDSPTVTVAGDLVLGHQGLGWGGSSPDSVGTYTINSGTLTVDGNIGVGGASTATDLSGNPLNVFTQNGGTVTITGLAQYPSPNPDYVGVGTSDHAGILFIGGAAGQNNDGGSGAYIMNGGILNAGVIEVGHSGLGIMTQNNDATVNAGRIWLGNAGGSTGTYNLNGGTINADQELIGLGGTGTFTQTGGMNTVMDLLDVGFQSAQGTYNLNGGSVIAGRIIVGDGTADNGGYGLFFGAGGTLNISADASLITGAMRVGVLNTGIVNQSGGTMIADSLTLGEIGTIPNGSGYYNLTGTGQLTVNGDLTIGVAGYGKVTQGTIGDTDSTSNTVGGNLILGAFDNIHPNDPPQPRAGEYILNTGTLSTNNTIVGDLGVGIFTQKGGTHTVANSLVVGDRTMLLTVHNDDPNNDPSKTYTSGGPSEGTYNLNNGTLTTNATIVGNYGIGTFTQIGGTHTIGDYLGLGSSIGAVGTYNLSGGELIKGPGEVKIGDEGLGYFNQSGNSVFRLASALYLGDNTYAQDSMGNPTQGYGKYTMTGGTITGWTDSNNTTSFGGIVLGEWGGKGEFIQSGGTVHIDNLTLARQANSIGNYELSGDSSVILTVEGPVVVGQFGAGKFTQSGGVLSSGSLTIGASVGFDGGGYSGVGIGTFAHSAGSNTVNGDLVIGQDAAATGTYNLSGTGILSTSNTFVGNNGIGEFNQTGGIHYVGVNSDFSVQSGLHELIVGRFEGSKGTYNLGGTGKLYAAREIVGDAGFILPTTGVFNQYGNTVHEVYGDLIIGQNPMSRGTFTLADNASLRVGGNVFIGDEGGTGTFIQSGTSGLTVVGTLVLGANSEGGNPVLYRGNGTYELSGNTLLKTGYTIVGHSGTGLFDQNGGTHTTTNYLIVGYNPTGNGTYLLRNGDLSTNRTYVGIDGIALFDQTGGTHKVSGADEHTNTGKVTIGSHGVYSLSGGTLDVQKSIVNNGTFNFIGGNLIVNGVANAGNFIFNSAASIDNFTQTAGVLSGAGNITGDVTINGGTVAPGNSPGMLTVNGNYSQGPVSTLAIELGGTTQGVDYDLLHVTGNAYLDGILKVDLYGGYTPTVGTYYDILVANGIGGPGFSTINGPGGYTWSVAYLDLVGSDGTIDTARLTANAVPIPGALWLFGPALAGLIGLRRRFRA